MSLVSFEFAIFFTVVALIYFRLPHRYRWGFLLLTGYVFYASWNIIYVPLLMFTTAYFYLIGQRITTAPTPAVKRNWLILGVALSLVILFFFQYFEFFSGRSINLPVPIGISFYTFTGIAYLVDRFRGMYPPVQETVGVADGDDEVKTTPALAPWQGFSLFMAFFPTLTSGPIERAGRVIPQFSQEVTFDEPRSVAALRLILWGIFKKLVIADRLAIYVNAVYDQPQGQHGVVLMIATLFYAFQLYADFSAYSDVAVGVAKLLGIDIIMNFKQPYYAMSVRDFWNRWHISLSTWIRDYMFMPLSRNLLRRSKGKYPRWIQGFSNLITMILVGLWHGPSWTFVVWGTLHGLYMSVESVLGWRVAIPKATSPQQRVIKYSRMVLTFVLIVIAWIFFRANTMDNAIYVLTHLFDFSAGAVDVTKPFAVGVLGAQKEFFVSLGLIAFLMVADWIDQNRGLLTRLAQQRGMIRWAFYYALGFGILISLVYGASTQEFIYMRF
ncbi:MAG TPA: MBOAT family O-acyltransferase [Phototrophicaceae bacterium]|jgi:D-alanyl-lipoteichoic acid acyltransferase DltB (MBOAT superfamily)|nr:MBOAT family O-acyltransferase [Phototrophicaceae bacterium]